MAKKDKRAGINALIKAVEDRDVLLHNSKILSNGPPNLAATNVAKSHSSDSRTTQQTRTPRPENA
jgi:hypothetical protein